VKRKSRYEDGEYEGEKPRAKRKKPAANSSGVLVAALAVGGVVFLAGVAAVVVLATRNKTTNDGAKTSPPEVTIPGLQPGPPPKTMEDVMSPGGRSERSLRKDPKWVRGPKARELVVGEWRDALGEATVLRPDGTYIEPIWFPASKDTATYRIIDDEKLELTHLPRAGNPKTTKQRYEYYVTDEELALIKVTDREGFGLAARTFFRTPIKAGGVGEKQYLAPILADARSGEALKRQVAFVKLKKLGKGAAIAIPTICELLNHPEGATAYDAAETLGCMEEAGGPAVPAMVAVLKNPNAKATYPVVLALGRIGPAAKDALPALRDLVNTTKSYELKVAAEGTIQKIEGKKP
jgi:hypothetical protein